VHNVSKYTLVFSAGFIAFNAAFFSITGLSHLFSGAFWSVVIMASSLELGKLVSASFLYQYWTTMNKYMRTYLTVGTVLLVLITSMGIFGYLSKAYQGATVGLSRITTQLDFYEEELLRLEEDKVYLKEEMSAQIALLPDNYITAKRKVRDDYSPLILKVNTQISELKPKIGELNQEMISTGIDVGPILYVADIFDTDIDSVVKYLIFILIFVFDPLAITLVIAANMVLETKQPAGKDYNNITETWYEEDPQKISSIKLKPKEKAPTKEKWSRTPF